jgi:hypothetical protein
LNGLSGAQAGPLLTPPRFIWPLLGPPAAPDVSYNVAPLPSSK